MRQWLKITKERAFELIHEGDESPGFRALQVAVGGFIQAIPQFYMVDQEGMPKHTIDIELEGKVICGTISEIWCHEESKLPLYAIKDVNEKRKWVKSNINPLSYILEPHDFMVGDIVAVIQPEGWR